MRFGGSAPSASASRSRAAQQVVEPGAVGKAPGRARRLLVEFEGAGGIEPGDLARQPFQGLLTRPHDERQKRATVAQARRPPAGLQRPQLGFEPGQDAGPRQRGFADPRSPDQGDDTVGMPRHPV